MSFYILTNKKSDQTKAINKIVKKFDLTATEYAFSDLEKSLYVFTWKTKETAHVVELDNNNLICSIGTFIYKDKYGDEALKNLYQDFIDNTFNLTDCTGHFNIIIKRDHKIYLYNDILGAWKIYQSQNGDISSSFYMLLECQQNLELDKQGIYEYILNGCTFGEKTIAKQINSLPAEKYFIIDEVGSIKQVEIPYSLVNQPDSTDRTMDELVDDYSKRLQTLFNTYKNLPTQIYRSAISGGFDSRLILAAFINTGTSPDLYVYGKETDADVTVAKNVAKTAKLPLDFIDKSQLPNQLNLDNFKSITEQNLFMYDALPYDGIFDNGNDYYDRLNRAENDKMLVNGSVGEIFRHFYYWPNKTMRIDDFIKSFHSRFDPYNMTDNFDFDKYKNNLKQEIKKVLKTKKEEISREEIEKLYPLLRARFWSSKDMVNNHRFGLSLYPFLEYNIINGTSTIDYNKKIYGRFEAKLMNNLSPKLASCNSDYGFTFSQEPSLKYKLKTQLITYQRPVFLRQLSYTIQSRRTVSNQPKFLSNDYLALIIDTKYPYMSQYFKSIESIDAEMMNRLATVEYVAQKFSFNSLPNSLK